MSRPGSPTSSSRRASLLWWLAVLGVALVGLVLRTWNLDFDERQHLHPDERHWSLTAASLEEAGAADRHGTVAGPVLDWLDGQRSPANAYRGGADTFVYGPVTLATARGVSGWLEDGGANGSQPASFVLNSLDAMGLPLTEADGTPRFDAGYEVDLVGRLLGALADTATIVVIALIGRRVGGRLAGLTAAVLAACSVIAIQLAHFLGSEPVLGLAAALTVLATLHIDRSERVRPAVQSGALAGLAAGAALAAKFSAVGIAAVPLLACAYLAVTRRRRVDVIRLVAVAVGALVAFRVLYPSAFNGLGLTVSDQFWTDMRSNREAVGLDLPPALQWSARVPVVEAVRWLFLFFIGPGAFIAAVGGAIALVRRRSAYGRWAAGVVVLAWVLPMAVVLRQSITTGRYFVPMLPALYACGGVGIAVLVRAARRSTTSRNRRVLAGAGAAALLGLSTVWAAAFVVGVHGDDHTRIRASRWIAEHVEPGSTLSATAWDDALPLAVEGVQPSQYELEELQLFTTDSTEKIEALSDQLAEIDYLVESSPRLPRSVTRIPARFPSTIALLDGLESGALGFEQVATFTSPAQLGPLQLGDSSADEAYSVYDHPEVRIWQRVRDLPPDEIARALDAPTAATALPIHPDDARANGGMLRPGERAENSRIGTYAQDFDLDANPVAQAVGWFVIIELIGLAAFAVFARALRTLPDAGLGLAKTIGLVSTGFAVFVPVAWLGWPLSRELVVACTVAWVALGGLAAYRRRALLAELWRARRRTLLLAEALTAVAFVAVVLLRAANPDLWHVFRGGEKPFEMEMFTAVLRTRTLPPYDPWYAGGTLNYYYLGYLLLSVPARLLATPPALAMNLGLAAVGSLATGAVFSAGAAVARLLRRGSDALATAGDGALRLARRAGMLAIAFVLVLPNAAIVPSIVDRLTGGETGPLDWWALSRTIPGEPVVTEFPAWSFLFGDLHPHVIDLPLLATAVAVALAWYRTLVARASRRSPLTLAVLVGVLVGAVRGVNTWDMPLAALVCAVPPLAALAVRTPWRRCLGPGFLALAVGILAWAPYWWRNEVADAGIELEELHTPLSSWTAHFGFFALATALVIVLTLTAGRTASRSRRAWSVVTASACLAIGVTLVSPDHASFAASALLAAASAAVFLAALRSEPDREAGWGAIAVAGLGWAMVAAIELVSIVNDFDRMNTVFKGWYQAWLLLALGSAVSLAGLAAPTHSLVERLRGHPRGVKIRAYASRALLVGALLMVTAFVQLALPARLDDRTSTNGLSLDGMAFLDGDLTITAGDQKYVPGDDRALIEWLRENVSGLPTVAEIPGEQYTWSGRIGSQTGLPTVIGWPYHQTQQRRAYEDTVFTRVADVNELYTSADPVAIRSALARYSIDYVVVGTTELAAMSADSRATLLDQPCLDVVFEDGDAFIAKVDHDCLAEPPTAGSRE